jgi:hypothetical protein
MKYASLIAGLARLFSLRQAQAALNTKRSIPRQESEGVKVEAATA